ncbi:hypothetical protein RJ639_040281 [Escallonia herrerae]|uniref:Reverse transcriptase RNase H-like domain-containing protein n=1 Tax=Escallonia herrerae TaxID=1293975 RepID=A0AA88WKH8_9ASTE|nr:hypothetical protein RJ639_040281 [Escallonia herrerae]
MKLSNGQKRLDHGQAKGTKTCGATFTVTMDIQLWITQVNNRSPDEAWTVEKICIMQGREEQEENARIINTISGGLASGGLSGQAPKAYAREVCITSQSLGKKQKTTPLPAISFSDDDIEDVKTPYDDPSVITIKAGNFDVKLVLVDNGSSTESKEALIIEDLQEDKKRQRGEPIKDLMSIELYPREKEKTARIGSTLKEDIKLKLVNLLQTYADILAWTAADMPGIDPEVITYKLNVAISAVLVRKENGIQKPIYNVSKVLQDVETRYPKIDKKLLALITSARSLRPYFQSHIIVVLTDQPLKKVLLSPEASRRLPFNPYISIKEVSNALISDLCYLPLRPLQSLLKSFNLNEKIRLTFTQLLCEMSGLFSLGNGFPLLPAFQSYHILAISKRDSICAPQAYI